MERKRVRRERGGEGGKVGDPNPDHGGEDGSVPTGS